MSKILFILWESGAGKTTLENILTSEYGFKSFDKLSSRPPRREDSEYMHLSALEIAEYYAEGLVHECIRYNGNMYAMRLPREEWVYVACLVPAGYHQFIDMGLEDKHEVCSVFLTHPDCGAMMRKRGDEEENIAERVRLNERLRRSAGGHTIINTSGGVAQALEQIKLLFPNLFYAQPSKKDL